MKGEDGMKIKALDCILLKDGREVVVLEDSIPGYYLVEYGDVEKKRGATLYHKRRGYS